MKSMRFVVFAALASATLAQKNTDKCHNVKVPKSGCNTLFCDDLELTDGKGPQKAELNQCKCNSTCYFQDITIYNHPKPECPRMGRASTPPGRSGVWCFTGRNCPNSVTYKNQGYTMHKVPCCKTTKGCLPKKGSGNSGGSSGGSSGGNKKCEGIECMIQDQI